MSMGSAEKAYEYDRAMKALASKGRTGGLAYEVDRLLEPHAASLDGLHPTEREIQAFANLLERKLLATTTPAPSNPKPNQSAPANPIKIADRVVFLSLDGTPGTVTDISHSRGIQVKWDDLNKPVWYRNGFEYLRTARAAATLFHIGDRVQSVGYPETFGVVTAKPSSDSVVVLWGDLKKGTTYCGAAIKHLRSVSDPRPFKLGDRVRHTATGWRGIVAASSDPKLPKLVAVRWDQYPIRALATYYDPTWLRHA